MLIEQCTRILQVGGNSLLSRCSPPPKKIAEQLTNKPLLYALEKKNSKATHELTNDLSLCVSLVSKLRAATSILIHQFTYICS